MMTHQTNKTNTTDVGMAGIHRGDPAGTVGPRPHRCSGAELVPSGHRRPPFKPRVTVTTLTPHRAAAVLGSSRGWRAVPARPLARGPRQRELGHGARLPRDRDRLIYLLLRVTKRALDVMAYVNGISVTVANSSPS